MLADGLGWPLFHGNWLAILALGLPIVILDASVSWFGLERPVLRLAHRIAPARRPNVPKPRDRHALRDA
jgi:peptidoglycan/LPS O-acetylase OafA/YrhL